MIDYARGWNGLMLVSKTEVPVATSSFRPVHPMQTCPENAIDEAQWQLGGGSIFALAIEFAGRSACEVVVRPGLDDQERE